MIPSPVLIDAGPLVAMLSTKDEHHQRCIEQSGELPETLFSCWPAITEAAYLLKGTPDGVEALLSRIDIGKIEILPLAAEDVPQISGILSKYRDQGFDFSDACLMHLAEREGIDQIFTLDRRHFSVYRTAVGGALELLPSP